MALRTLERISCKVFGHGACECNPSVLSTVQFCRPISTLQQPNIPRRRKITESTKASVISSVPHQIRLLSSKPDFGEKASDASSPVDSSSPTLQNAPSKPDSEENLNHVPKGVSMMEKMKKMWDTYGIVAVGTHLGVFVTTLTSLFLALDHDIFNAASVGVDPMHAIQMFSDIIEKSTGNKHFPDFIREHPRVGTFVIALAMTKISEPVRIGITIAAVPSIARVLGKAPEHGKT